MPQPILIRRFGRIMGVIMIAALIPGTSRFSKLEQIKQAGTLHVLTRNDPTAYYESPTGYTGLEYDLVTLFAKQLGVKATFEIPGTSNGILKRIAKGRGDIAAASLTITEQRNKKMRFAPAYHEITEQLIYRSGSRRPNDVASLTQGIIEVAKGTSHIDSLAFLKEDTPELSWNVNDELDTNGLLYLVNEGLIDYTVADSNQALLIRRFYPKLNVAFDISEPRQLAWALSLSDDNSLYDEVVRFFKRIKQDKTLDQLLEKYYGHANSLSYIGNCKFRQQKKTRLPLYQGYFHLAAAQYDIDWRLLAAIGYQESRWLNTAVSPTGVKGIMMLTSDTAAELGIDNRVDPAQSIDGGARYFQQRHQIISAQIPEPDRTWFALASYNVGLGHLEDARTLTKKQGGNPDKWMDVKQRLPLLAEEKWHQHTKYGYARGHEPVTFVENIRSYYDLLVWLTEENQIKKNAMDANSPPDPGHNAITIVPSAL
ncbi:MAG: membrane-bound lytic murein transglycosylase MltF [Methylobacter sp.]|nr:membrane-bound lytic murein transglycosylase MltF [Methylobacter sp.]MDP2428118.1 membrane-bound lytic murein transglycosylase MltF [Methylobacter sp.]MDP3054414.1 membrane-bound lytic murein transglycosylase MltF [Methylobacter sp.]MDP3364323.1 membrane-bound lytic murein transglycosylase MltF [Methylobacter sp.]MDZ4220028.1 membrane-bound lytic murein transglycosylase MltF [Methylobacter sp.]